MKLNIEKNSFDLTDQDKEAIKEFKKMIIPELDNHLIFERESITNRIDRFISSKHRINELENIKRAKHNHSCFCEITTYEKPVFLLNDDNRPEITKNEYDFLYFVYRTGLNEGVYSQGYDQAFNIAKKSIEVSLIDKLIIIDRQPIKVRLSHLENNYLTKKGIISFNYLLKTLEYKPTIKLSIIYRLINTISCIKKSLSTSKFIELVKKDYESETIVDGQKLQLSKLDPLSSDDNTKRLRNAEKLLSNELSNNFKN